MSAGKCLGMGGLAVDRSAERGAIRAKIEAHKRSPNRVLAGPRSGLLDGYEGAAR